MARRVFFSFHFQHDIWRVNQVRHAWVTKPSIEEAGYIDAAAFEQVQRQGDAAIQRWIDSQLNGTSVTAVLVGAETAGRPWVQYELRKSVEKGNGLLAIYINNVKVPGQALDVRGRNPLDDVMVNTNMGKLAASLVYRTYDWVNDDGYSNIGAWVEQAAKLAGR